MNIRIYKIFLIILHLIIFIKFSIIFAQEKSKNDNVSDTIPNYSDTKTNYYKHHFARVIKKEDNIVIIDIPENAWLSIREEKRFNVYNDGKKVGLIEIYNVSDNYAKATIKRGKSKIRIGNICKEKDEPNLKFSLSNTIFPIEINANEKYKELSGEKLENPKNRGSFTKLSMTSIYSFVPEIEIGRVNLGTIWFIEMGLNGLWTKGIIAELFEFNYGIGLGISLSEPKQKWIRPPNNYNDIAGSVNSGEAVYPTIFNYQTFGGFQFHLHETKEKTFVIYSNCGYFGYLGMTEDWEDKNYKKEENGKVEYFKVNQEWLQYKINKVGGLGFQLGISIIFH